MKEQRVGKSTMSFAIKLGSFTVSFVREGADVKVELHDGVETVAETKEKPENFKLMGDILGG